MYLDHCGVSLGVRTIAYDAASEWLHLYNDMHPDELKWDEDAPFCEVIPYLIEDCNQELLEKYDIAYIEVEEEKIDVPSDDDISIDDFLDDSESQDDYELSNFKFKF